MIIGLFYAIVHAAINRQRELSGTRKVYGDYTIELLGTNFDRVAIINHRDNSILEFDISGDPNDIFNELDKFLEDRKLSFDLFAEFLGKFNDDSAKQKNIDSNLKKIPRVKQNRRIPELPTKEEVVSFEWRDYSDESKEKIMTVSAFEFIRRFLLHVCLLGLQKSVIMDY